MKRGVTRNVQLQPRSASGVMIPTALNASALRDAYGIIIGAIGIPTSPGLQERLAAGLMAGRRFLACHAINIGQNAPDLVVSVAVEARIKDAIPLRAEQQHALLDKFTIVIRVTVKGNIVVATLQ